MAGVRLLFGAGDADLAAEWDDEAQVAFSSWLEETISSGVNLPEPGGLVYTPVVVRG
jgi:hypothetical protein